VGSDASSSHSHYAYRPKGVAVERICGRVSSLPVFLKVAGLHPNKVVGSPRGGEAITIVLKK